MRFAMPDVVRELPLDRPQLAIQTFASIIGELREAPAADLELIATDAVEMAVREGACLMAVVTPPEAAPALLTGVVVRVPASWDTGNAETLRDSMENVGGPDVRETVIMDTNLGPAVIVQRIPGIEQARERRPLALQLQAFVPESGTDRVLLLTLACPSADGWSSHQSLFGELVASAVRDHEDESFEHDTYQL
jgi:hypothetical protein